MSSVWQIDQQAMMHRKMWLSAWELARGAEEQNKVLLGLHCQDKEIRNTSRRSESYDVVGVWWDKESEEPKTEQC